MSRRTVIIGSPEIQTSVKGENIITEQGNWSYEPRVKHLSFMNYQSCTIRINDSDEIYLRELQGISLKEEGQYIDSFVIEDDGIEYQFIGVC